MVAQQSRSRRYFQAASTCPPAGATVAALHTQKSRLQRGKFPWNWKHAHAASQRPNKRQYIQCTFYLHGTLRAPLRFAHSGRTRFFPSSLHPISAFRPNQVNVCVGTFLTIFHTQTFTIFFSPAYLAFSFPRSPISFYVYTTLLSFGFRKRLVPFFFFTRNRCNVQLRRTLLVTFLLNSNSTLTMRVSLIQRFMVYSI